MKFNYKTFSDKHYNYNYTLNLIRINFLFISNTKMIQRPFLKTSLIRTILIVILKGRVITDRKKL